MRHSTSMSLRSVECRSRTRRCARESSLRMRRPSKQRPQGVRVLQLANSHLPQPRTPRRALQLGQRSRQRRSRRRLRRSASLRRSVKRSSRKNGISSMRRPRCSGQPKTYTSSHASSLITSSLRRRSSSCNSSWLLQHLTQRSSRKFKTTLMTSQADFSLGLLPLRSKALKSSNSKSRSSETRDAGSDL